MNLDLSTAQRFLAVVGAVAVVLAPFVKAWVRQAVHAAVTDAPAMIDLKTRVAALEGTVDRHDQDVRLIPRLVTVLDRMERTLEDLNTTLRERVARLEATA